MTAAAVLLLTLYLVERNLEDQLLKTYPKNSPNLFFIDIQPSQQAAFLSLLKRPTTLYPVVRSRLTAINGQPIDRQKERRRHGDNLARPFNLTFRRNLLEDERILEGDGLFKKSPNQSQVSVLDTVTKMGRIGMEDRLTFNIQGLEMEAVVTSIRTRTQASFRPFFYFVFEPLLLTEAPHTYFAAIHCPVAGINDLRHKVVSQFPNVTVIDATRALSVFGQIGLKLAAIVRILGLVSCLVGLLIMISALVATRQERLRQAVYYRIVGASKSLIQRIFITESALIGFMAAGVATLLAQTSTWLICRQALDIDYGTYALPSLIMGLLVFVAIMGVGWLASYAVLQYSPLKYLREHAES